MDQRLKNTYFALKKERLDCLIVSSCANITYLCRRPACDAHLIVSPKANTYFTDGRYIEEVKKYIRGFKLERVDSWIMKAIAVACLKSGYKRVGFEERSLSFYAYSQLRRQLPSWIDLIPAHDIIGGLRQLKDARELQYIRKATEITQAAFEFMRGFLRPGLKEAEVAAEIIRFMRYKGACAAAFEPIVASGENSAFPHHRSSQKKIKKNEVVLIDAGADYLGYKSDLTRVFFLGRINPLAAKVYALVRRAQDKAIKKIRPALKMEEIDSAARRHISRSGYGGYFNHSLGHGIGLEIHEGASISPKVTAKLKKGMVFTVEPAVYLPGKFGIRIEDLVRVTAGGREVISGSLDK